MKPTKQTGGFTLGFKEKASALAVKAFEWAMAQYEKAPEYLDKAMKDREQTQKLFEMKVARMEQKSNSELNEIFKTQPGLNRAAAGYVLKSRGVVKMEQSEEK